MGNIRLTESDEQKPDAEHRASHGTTMLLPETGEMLRRFFAPHNRARFPLFCPLACSCVVSRRRRPPGAQPASVSARCAAYRWR